MGDQVKVGRGVEASCEIPGELRAVLVDDDDFHVVHIERERIAEEQDEQQRQRKGHVQAPVVPDDVVELLPGHGLYVSGIQIIAVYPVSFRPIPVPSSMVLCLR